MPPEHEKAGALFESAKDVEMEEPPQKLGLKLTGGLMILDPMRAQRTQLYVNIIRFRDLGVCMVRFGLMEGRNSN